MRVMTGHALRRESDPLDYRLTDQRFRVQCSCGWQAPGWFGDDGAAFRAWSAHLSEQETS